MDLDTWIPDLVSPGPVRWMAAACGLVLTLSSAPALAEGPDAPNAQRHEDAGVRAKLERARAARDAGEVDKAQRAYDAILSTQGDAAWLYAEVGQMFAAAGYYGRALPYLSRAVELDSLDVDTQVELANARDGLGHNAEAIRLYKRVLILDPNHRRARFNLGRLQYVVGDLERAEATYRDLIARHEDHWKALNNLGLILLDRGEPTAAMAPLRRALRLKPGDPGVLYNIGRAHARRDQHDRALKIYARAIEGWGPEDLAAAPLHFSIGNSHFALGRYEAAIAAYEKAVTLDPEYWDAHLNLGAALANVGRNEEAIAALQAAVDYQPDKVAVLRQMATCYFNDDDYEAALKVLARPEIRSDGAAWALKAKVHDARGDSADASVARSKACALGHRASCRGRR